MNDTLKNTLDLFLENEDTMLHKMSWNNAPDDVVCALEYSVKNKKVDVERIKEAMEIIKKKTDTVSQFQGPTYLMLATEMAQVDQMEAFFDHVQDVYSLVMKGKWISSSHYIIAAMVIAQHTNGNLVAAQQYVDKAMYIYSRMKENHPCFTTKEDMGFATLLAVTGLDEVAVIEEMERCFNYLSKANIGSANGIQSLSHVLSLNIGDVEKKCNRTIAIYENLKSQGKNLGGSFELSILGGLAFTNGDSQTLAKEILEIDTYLKSKGVFESLGLGDKQRLIYASILEMQRYCKSETKGDIISIVIATQVAMLMVMNANLMVINTFN